MTLGIFGKVSKDPVKRYIEILFDRKLFKLI